jgi:hypothetical protein
MCVCVCIYLYRVRVVHTSSCQCASASFLKSKIYVCTHTTGIPSTVYPDEVNFILYMYNVTSMCTTATLCIQMSDHSTHTCTFVYTPFVTQRNESLQKQKAGQSPRRANNCKQSSAREQLLKQSGIPGIAVQYQGIYIPGVPA